MKYKIYLQILGIASSMLILGSSMGFAQDIRYYQYLSYDPTHNTYSYNGLISPFELESTYHKVFINDRNRIYKGYFYHDYIPVYGAHFRSNMKLRKVERYNREGNLESAQYYNSDGIKIREEFYNKLLSIPFKMPAVSIPSMALVSIFTGEEGILLFDRTTLNPNATKTSRIYGQEINFFNSNGDLMKKQWYDTSHNQLLTYVYQYAHRRCIRIEAYRLHELLFYSLLYYQRGHQVAQDYFNPEGRVFLKEQYAQDALQGYIYYDQDGKEIITSELTSEGLRTSEVFLYNENQEWVKKWNVVIDGNGRIQEALCVNREGSTLLETQFQLDEQGGVQSLNFSGSFNTGAYTYLYETKPLIPDKARVESEYIQGEIEFSDDYKEQRLVDQSGKTIYHAFFDENNRLVVRVFSYLSGDKIDEVIRYDKNGMIIGKERYLYYGDGNLKSINYYDAEHTIYQSSRFTEDQWFDIHFDDQERPVIYYGYEAESEQPSFIDYLDEYGRIYKNLQFDEEGILVQQYIAEYDRFDRKVHVDYLDRFGNLTQDVEYNERGMAAKLNIYDDNENLTQYVMYRYRTNGTLESARIYDGTDALVELFAYNAFGKRIKRTIFLEGEIEWVILYTRGIEDELQYYVYTEDGQLDSIERYSPDEEFLGYTQYYYNEDGAFIREQAYDADGNPIN